MSDVRLAANDVSYAYDTSPAVRHVTLCVQRGEMVSLLGPNGSGKSTLLSLLSGARVPDSGEVVLDCRPLQRYKPRQRARRIAVVPQHTDPHLMFRVRDLVRMGRTPYSGKFGLLDPDDTGAVRRSLAATRTHDLADRRFSELSGGEQQRVVLAMALAQEPEFLLLDEPTVHLDLLHQYELLELLTDLHRTRDVGVLAVMHDINLASLYFDRLAVLEGGRLLLEGPPEDVLLREEFLRIFRAPLHVIEHPATGSPQVLLAPDHQESGAIPDVPPIAGHGGTGQR